MTAATDFMDSDIVKQGYLMIKRPPSSGKVRIKAWQSRFFLLRDFSENSRQRLEYYKDESTFQASRDEKTCSKFAIFLDSVIHIGETNTSKTKPHAFMIVCTAQGALTLACNSQESRSEWLSALNRISIKVHQPGPPYLWSQENTSEDSAGSTPETPRRSPSLCGSAVDSCASVQPSQAYPVTTRLTPPAERNDIRGEYVMQITERDVLLRSAAEAPLTVRWPLKYLRAFKNEGASSAETKLRHLLTLEVGRRTATGEGIFQFFTDYGDDIIALIRLHSNLVLQSTAAEKREVFRRRAMSSLNTKAHGVQHTDGLNCAKQISLPSRLGSPDPANSTEQEFHGERSRPLLRQAPIEANSIVLPDFEKTTSICTNVKKPRLASNTDSSEDDVFINKLSSDIGSPTEGSPDSTYVVLLPDENAEPIHISDAGLRKGSCSSQASVVNGEETKSSRGTTSSASCLSEDSELDCDGYLKSDVIMGEDIPSRGKSCSKFSNEDSELSCPANDTINRKISEDAIFATNPTFAPKVTDGARAHSKFPPKQRAEANAQGSASPPNEEDNARERKNQELLNKILAQMELPQQHDVSEVFPSVSAKRGSLDSACSSAGPDMPRGREHVDNSKPEMRVTNQDPGSSPPPLPARPEPASPRRKSFSSLSEIADELRGKIDLTGTGNPTVFAKRMRHTPTLLGGPRGSIPKDIRLNARLLEQSLFAKNSPLPCSPINGEKPKAVPKPTERNIETRDCVSENIVTVSKTIETAENLTSSSEKTSLVTKSFEALDIRGEESRKRKDSKASKMVKRFFKNMARSPPDSPASASRRRDSSDSYASEECSEDDSEKPRRHSLSPGFFGETRVGSRSPEGSPGAARKLSSEEKGLRTMSQGERPRKWSKEERECKSSKPQTDELHERNTCDLPRKFSLLTSETVLEENTDDAPALPPRIKPDPPPLPPRRPKSPNLSCDLRGGSAFCKQLLSCPNKETKLFSPHRGSNTCELQSMPPPPLPPRRESAPSTILITTPADVTDPSCTCDSSASRNDEKNVDQSPVSFVQSIGEDSPVPARPPKGRKLGRGNLIPEPPVQDSAASLGSHASETQEIISMLNNNREKPNRDFPSSSPEVTGQDIRASGNGTDSTPDRKAYLVLEDSNHVIDSSGSFSSAFSTEA